MFVESKTNPSSTTNYRNWQILRKDGYVINNTRGGCLVQVDPVIKMGKANAPKMNNQLDEILHFSVPLNNDRLHLFLVYIHHSTNTIEPNLLIMASLYKYAVIIGDFNFTARKNRQLEMFLANSEFVKVDTAPTFLMPNNDDTTPDAIIYTRNLANNLKTVKLFNDLGSDHLGFHIEIDLNRSPAPLHETLKINLNKCITEEVNKQLLCLVEDIHNSDITRQLITNFNEKIASLVLQNSPKQKIKYYTHTLPPFIIHLIKQKRKMYREYRTLQIPDMKRQLNDLNKIIHKHIAAYRQHHWIEACQKVNSLSGQDYWSQIATLSKYKTRVNIPTIVENNTEYITNKEKAEIFAQHFKETYTPQSLLEFNKENENAVNNWYQDYFTEINVGEPVDSKIEEDEYFSVISVGKNSAPGYDNVTRKIIRELEDQIHKFIIKIYEFCLKHHYFPPEWKAGTIIVIPKPNSDHSKVTNFRPITLLPVLGKILEKIIRNRINIAVSHKIPQYQFGFREKRSTLLPLSILVSNVQTARLEGMKSAILLLDVKKAFDSVWHKGILFQLHRLNCPDYLLLIIKSFLENRSLQVKIGNQTSIQVVPLQGVPQGSPLSPILFNIYCYNLYNHCFPDYHHFEPHSYILQYADDAALVTHGSNVNQAISTLQVMMNRTNDWFKKWRLSVNPDKSKLIIFNHTISQNSPSIYINNVRIQPSPHAKYLGVLLDNKLNFNLHSQQMKKKTTTRANHFKCLTCRKEGINTHTAVKIYKSICRPLLDYAHVLFHNCRNTAYKNFQVAETSSLRKITKMRHPINPLYNPSNALLYELTTVIPIEERHKTLTLKFANSESNFEILSQFCNQRNRNMPARLHHPEHTVWEIIQDLRTQE